MIAWLGTGLLGGNFTRRLLERGEQVAVWNRSPEKAQPLAEAGARVAASAADAIAGASIVHLTLSDDAAVDGVLEPLAEKIGNDTTIVDHTTTAPTPTAERVARWKDRGITFVHAPVFMGPPNARDGSGLMLVSGEPAHYARVKDALAAMTGKLIELGGGPERAAAFKLFGNLAIVANVCALADIFAFAKGMGIAPADARDLFDTFNVSAQYAGRGKRMAEGAFAPPMWELAMARKDVRLMLEEAQRRGARLPLTETVASVFDRALADGHGNDDVGAIAAPFTTA